MPIEQTDIVRTQLRVEGAPQYAAELQKGADSLEKFAGAEGHAGKQASAMAAGLQALAATGMTAAFGSLAKGMTTASAQMERYNAQFKVLMGSASAARAEMSTLVSVAAKTPFDLPGIIEADRMLKAFNLDLGGTEKTLVTFGDAAAAMGVPLQQMIAGAARFKAGVFSIDEAARLGVTREKLAEFGIQFSKTGELLNREDLFPAFIKLIGRFSGTMAEVSKTTEGRLSNLGDAVFQLKSKIGDTMTPAFKVGIESATKLVEAMGRLGPATQRQIGMFVVLGTAVGGLAAAYNGYLMLKRLGIIAENTDAIAKGRVTASIVAKDVAAMRSMGISEKVIAQLTVETAAANATAQANMNLAGARGAGAGAAALGIAGRVGSFVGRWGPMVAGGYLAMNALGTLTRGRGEAGQVAEQPSNPLLNIGAGAWLGSKLGLPGAIAGAVAGAGYSVYDMSSTGRHNQQIDVANQAQARAEIRRLKQVQQNKEIAEAAEKKIKAEEEALKNLEKGMLAQKDYLAVLEAQGKIVAAKNDSETAHIPILEKQVEGAKKYAALLDDLVKNLPVTEKGEEERAKALKDRLDATVAIAELEKSIRDIRKKSEEESAAFALFMVENERQRVDNAIAKRKAEEDAGRASLSQQAANIDAMLSLAQAKGQLTPALLNAANAARADIRSKQLTDIGSQEAGANLFLSGNAREAELMRLRGARIGLSADAYSQSQGPRQLIESTLRGWYDLAKSNPEMAKQYGMDWQAMGGRLLGMYREDYANAAPGSMKQLESMQQIFAILGEDDKWKSRGDLMAKAFNDRLGEGVNSYAAKLTSELHQQALNLPSGASELLPAFGRKRPRNGTVVMQNQIVINGGNKEEIMTELSKLLDSLAYYESGAYSVTGR